MKTLALSLCLFLPSLALAQPSGWDDPTICFLDGATGSYIAIDGDASFILSCAHGLDGPIAEGRSREGQRLVCKVVAIDEKGDAAILKFNGKASQPAKIAAGPAPIGSQLWYCGFPMGGPLKTKTLVARQGFDGLNIGDGSPIPGDSGGPVRNSNGEIVGTITGVNGNTGFYSQWKTINRLVDEVRANGYVETQCGQGGCGSGSCPPQYYYQQPQQVQRPQQRPPLPAIQPINPPITPQQPQRPVAINQPGPTGPAGPPGPEGKHGPAGPAGSDATCDCGPKWVEINQQLTQIRADVDASAKAVSELTLIVGDLSKRPASPTIDEIVAEVERRRKPPRIRIFDPLGQSTTDFITLYDNTDNDLKIEQKYTPSLTPVH
jgi:hypothetical protein